MDAESNNAISLYELLSGKSVAALRVLAKGFHVKGSSTMRKPELISAVTEELKEPGRLEELLYVVGNQEWELFQETVRRGTAELKENDLAQYKVLTELCYLAVSRQSGHVTVSVPAEVRSMFQTLAEGGFLERKTRYDLLDRYALAATNLYGVISQDDFLTLFNRQNEEEIGVDEVFSALIRFIAVDAPYCFWKDYLVSDDFAENDFSDVPDLISRIGDKPRYIPEKQELLRYADPDYFERTEAVKRLKQYLMEKLHQDNDQAEDIVEEVHYACMVETKTQDIFRIFQEYRVKFNERQFAELAQLVTRVSNSTRLWSNNGHTPNEMFNLFERNKLMPFPGQTKLRKIGRNEPCPCGSGKKYKRCCGR